jgi:hypothetical protein
MAAVSLPKSLSPENDALISRFTQRLRIPWGPLRRSFSYAQRRFIRKTIAPTMITTSTAIST